MKHKQRILRITGFALILVLFGALFPQASAPEGNRLLAAYSLTWHAKARGSKYLRFPNPGDRTSKLTRHSAEMSGSAIVRFQFEESTKRLWHYDTRYLSFTMTDNYDQWETYYRNPAIASPGGDCSTHWSVDIPAESASGHSGFYIPPEGLENPIEKRADGVTVMPAAFNGYLRLSLVRFDSHNHTSATQWTAPDKERALYWCADLPERDWTNKQSGGDALLIHSLLSQKLDLEAVSRTDDSTFALNTRFTVPDNIGSGGAEGAMIEVELTAEARRLGKCPCAISSVTPLASGLSWASSPTSQSSTPPPNRCTPSQDWVCFDDPALKNGKAKEVIDVWPIDHEIDPNGSIPVQGGAAKIKGMGVKVRVTTCEGIPVKGETVQITVDPQEFSGDHNHPNPRPGGKLNDKEIDKSQAGFCPCIEVTTDEKGYAYAASYPDVPAGTIRFQPPRAGTDSGAKHPYEIGVAGEYQITARSKQFPDSKASDSITAKVPNLEKLEPTGPNFNCCPQEEEAHKTNNYGTAGTLNAFRSLANKFKTDQDNHNAFLQSTCHLQPWNNANDYPVSFNDIALEYGGIFDRGKDWKVNLVEGHGTHNKGEGGDFNRFRDIHITQTATDCLGMLLVAAGAPPVPITVSVPIRAWLLVTLLEDGRSIAGAHWDCRDLALSDTDCNALNQQGQVPAITMNQQGTTGFPHRLHLHVED